MNEPCFFSQVADSVALEELLLRTMDIHYNVDNLPAGKVLLDRLREEFRVAEILRSFEGKDTLECYEAMKAALVEADDLDLGAVEVRRRERI